MGVVTYIFYAKRRRPRCPCCECYIIIMMKVNLTPSLLLLPRDHIIIVFSPSSSSLVAKEKAPPHFNFPEMRLVHFGEDGSSKFVGGSGETEA